MSKKVWRGRLIIYLLICLDVAWGNLPLNSSQRNSSILALSNNETLFVSSSVGRDLHNGLEKKFAVCITGQVRTFARTLFNLYDNLFSVIGDFDVYMYIQSRGTSVEPKVGDSEYCKSLFNRTLKFHAMSAYMHCLVEQEKDIAFNETILRNFYYPDFLKQQGFLKQLYGLKRCHSMIAKYTADTGVSYEWIIRLRPDNIFFQPFPAAELFKQQITKNVIFFSDPSVKCCGNQDIFNVGRTEDMHIFMNRFDALFDGSFQIPENRWSAENFALDYSKSRGIDMRVLPGLHLHVLRFSDGERNYTEHMSMP